MSNVLLRSISGLVYVIILLGAVLIHPYILLFITLAFNFIALSEFSQIGIKFGIRKSSTWIYLNCIFFLAAALIIQTSFVSKSLLAVALLLPLLYFVIELYRNDNQPIIHIAYISFGSLYITLPLFLLNELQFRSTEINTPYVLAILIFIWVNDTFAYLVGKAFGKRKLFERISPKKSWEGFFGGLIMVVVTAFIFSYFYSYYSQLSWILFGLLAAVSAVLGDFVESLLKRSAGIKDSGTIMPGHGGLLDRIDSLLFASPVIFIYLILIENI